MLRTNKKEQPKCLGCTSAFFVCIRKEKKPLLKVVPTIDGREGNDSSTKLPKTKKSIFLKERCSWLGYPDSNQE